MAGGRLLNMAEEKQNTASITSSITATFTKSLFHEQYYDLSEYWRQIQARATIYNNLDEYKFFTRSWGVNRNTRWHLREVQKGLEAIEELEQSNILAKEEISYEIRQAINAELSCLELRQYRRLIKDQEIYRPEVLALHNSLQIKINHSRQRMREKKLSEAFLVANHPKVEAFLKDHEKFYFDFGYAIKTSGIVGDVISTSSSTITIGRFIPLKILSNVSPKILFTIPAISGIVAAIPLLFGTLKSYNDNRKTVVKVFNSILAVIVFAGIGVAISMPFTVPVISGTFIIGAIIKDYFKPAYDLIIGIRKRTKQLSELQANAGHLIKIDAQYLQLNSYNKTTLLKSLELYVAKHNVDTNLIIEARKLITAKESDLHAISAHPLIQQATKRTDANGIKEFLYRKTEQQCTAIQADVRLLRSQRWRMLALSANGVITMVGTVFFCIPTPLTMLIGASIVGASYAINMVIKYDLIPKGYKFTKNLFRDEKPHCPHRVPFKLNASMECLNKTLLDKNKRLAEKNEEIEQANAIEKVYDIIEPPNAPALTRTFAPS